MSRRAVAATSAVLVLLAGAVSRPALAVEDSAAGGTGSASSTLTLLDVALGGKALSVLELALRSDAAGGAPTTSLVVTPLTVDGTAYGRQSVGRDARLRGVDSRQAAPRGLSDLATVRSPAVDVSSSGGSSRAGTASLGGLSVLGMPLALDGRTDIVSTVGAAGATGGKTLVVSQLALPSLADVLAALGLDLRALPHTSLAGLLDGLDLHSRATNDARAALAAALAPVADQVGAAEALVASTDAAVRGADRQLDAATADLADATAALNAATAALHDAGVSTARLSTAGFGASLLEPVTDPLAPVTDPLAPVTDPVTEPLPGTVQLVDEVAPVLKEADPVLDPVLDTVTQPVLEPITETVSPVLEPVLPLPDVPLTVPADLQPLVDAYEQAKATYDIALASVKGAEATLAGALSLMKDALAALDALLAPFRTQVDAVVGAVLGLLDATPLVSVDHLELSTRSSATSAGPGGQHAEVVGGHVRGLRVLGTDVLSATTGSGQLDVTDLVGGAKAQVDAVVTGLTGSLAGVLSAVPGLPGLAVPAPTVQLLTSATFADVVDGFGVAGTALRALAVTWPGIAVPTEAAVAGAAQLPAVSGIPGVEVPGLLKANRVTAASDVLTQPLTLAVATLEDRARFRPASVIDAPGDGTSGDGSAPRDGGTPTDSIAGPGTPGAGTPDGGTPGTGTSQTPVQRPRTTPVALGQLPRTGAEGTAPLLALLLVAAGLGLQRRYRAA